MILLLSAGNVVQSLSFSSIVPLTIWAFTFDWPLLDPAPALGSKFVLGTGAIPIYLLHACTLLALLWLPAPGFFMDTRHQSRVLATLLQAPCSEHTLPLVTGKSLA